MEILRDAEGGSGGGGGGGELNLPEKLPQKLETMDGLPDYAHGLYEKEGEGYIFKGLGPLQSALARTKKERGEFKTKLEALSGFTDLDMTPDEIKAAKERLAELEADPDNKGKKSGDSEEIDKIKTSMQSAMDAQKEQLTKELNTEREKRETAEKTLERYVIRSEVTMNLTKDKLDGDADLILPHVEGLFRMVEGKPAVFDADGEQCFNGKGDPMSPYELLHEMREGERFGRLFNSTGAGGGGAPAKGPGGAKGKTLKRSAFDAMGPTERQSAIEGGATIVDG